MPAILTTLTRPALAHPGIESDEWRIEAIERDQLAPVQVVGRVLRHASRYDVVVLDGSVGLRNAYADLVAAGLIAHRASSPPVVIADSTWKRGTWWLDRLACRIGVQAIDAPTVTFCVLSTHERRVFPSTWGVDPRRVVFTPWCYTLTEQELATPTSDDGGVFAGGESMRDHAPLLEAASRLPLQFRVAAKIDGGGSVPANVRVGRVPHPEFVRLMARAAVVVVPLSAGIERSAGQQTYLNAMALAKPVVVTDSPGSRDYVEHGETGLVVPPNDAAAMEDALRWVTSPGNAREVAAMGQRARTVTSSRFRPLNYAESVLRVARSVVDATS